MAWREAPSTTVEAPPNTRNRSRRILSHNSASSRSESDLRTNRVDTGSSTSQFNRFLVSSVMETGEEIGRGAYGIVYKIRRWGTVCAAKKLHDLPLNQVAGSESKDGLAKSGHFDESNHAQRSASSSQAAVSTAPSGSRNRVSGGSSRDRRAHHTANPSGQAGTQQHPRSASSASVSATNKSRQDILARFEKECHLLSNLRHPYIVQFLGVYIEKLTGTPVIVMEYLPNSLSNLVKGKPIIPRYLQISILYNISLGLAYLHGHSPAIIHRDLTANNVLLTSNMVAKIADLGVARILDLTPKTAMQLTSAPGTAAYMPPEALAHNPSYNTKIDIFSFGVLGLHLVSQSWPIPTEAVRVQAGGRLLPFSEVERRKVHFDTMGSEHCLYQLTTECLQNDPAQRPDISKVVFTLETLQSKYPFPSTSYLDLLQVLENNRSQLEAKGMQIATNKEQIQKYITRIETRDSEISSLKETVKNLEKQLVIKMKTNFMDAEKAFKKDSSTNGGLVMTQRQSPSCSSSPTPPTSRGPVTALTPTLPHFIWKKDADLPFATFGAKSVFLEDKLYIGGGDCKDMTSDKVVYEYDINGAVRKWTALPSAPVAYFSMGKVNEMLVLVGGLDVNRKIATSQLTNWDRESQRWATKLPPMMTARQDCTVTNYKEWLLVAGGLNFKKPIYNVELLDTANMAWHTTHPLPKPSVGMTSCVVGNTWYLVGGTNFTEPTRGESGPKEYTFSLKLDENIATNKWEALADTPLYCSSAVAFGEHLMAIGGTDSPTSRTYNASMFLYSMGNEKWMYVGNMPTARSHTSCIVIDRGTLVVMGGQERGAIKGGKTVEILYC